MTAPSPARARAAARRRPLWPWLFLLPALLLFAVFDYYPFLRAVVLSFQATDLFGRPAGWAGLENYTVMLSSGEFWSTFAWTLVFTVASTVVKLVLGLAIAVPLARRLRGTAVLRSAVLIPMAVSTAVGALIFSQILAPSVGPADQLADLVGLGPVGWLTDAGWARVSVLVVDTWAGISFVVLLLLAAIDGVPGDITEAAGLDGCTGLRYIRHMLVPSIAPMLLFLAVTQSVAALREFTVINALTGGGPAGATQTLVVDLYTRAFGDSTNDYSSAAASGMVLAVFIVVLSAVQFALSARKVTYR
ncbi:carbohydrate ABC transporter permease [Corynebacterium bovis]|uniref:sn-glycerol 3-phosphate transport system permease protein n=1 Tax=Corynebacterium bovis DSM 20582 = CIP 54.80 TaxID=927655 RepID=A0A8I0CM45_9CORY|nr:sugar ABC transporter permease [Corynebacterium bovis]MBB3115319.1 sn-glycerol 3-phosphate transport system permease protein [Corynebacterium bovis DSM 20582 = CIP 54.80]QQC48213.1 sugar ABC transporter permease [Corynebacterium bovis]RRO80346.1 sugar ABC transporter permease [Corynebacterium bovis]RRO81647.1 sugar ABC transporter permease [Corynebacterium bovis]RRO84203.1 sugar ABC transporter permease [Corynebacterium bovis]